MRRGTRPLGKAAKNKRSNEPTGPHHRSFRIVEDPGSRRSKVSCNLFILFSS